MNEIKKCFSCNVEMQCAGEASFRTGGTSGGWNFIFGKWAELGEDTLPLRIYVCPRCGRIELYADEQTRRSLLPSSGENKP
jgi:predicted RNA-binding Zn-ribbon protein involved in translation (DUF1610 family)